MSLSQETFESLMKLEKRFVDNSVISLGGCWTKEIESLTTKDKFQLDYRKSKIEVRKFSFNHRTRTTIVLVRYCSMHRHTNPDGRTFDGAHLHLYCEGFGDKIAVDAKEELGIDPETSSKEEIFDAVLKYCNINIESIQTRLEI